ncbi:MAG: hypothetical protein O7D91_13525 [Planctomycetota bacterium]|nr:hypothetical protein [Planctomycetota bacterium]
MVTDHRREHVRMFLTHIFPESFRDAYIEIRLLSDVEKNKCYGQRWYRSVHELVDDVEDFVQLAEQHHACVAFSPALRSKKAGTKDAVVGSWCVWNDQPSITGNKDTCIQRLQEAELSLLVVDSGNSAHGYVLLDEFFNDIDQLEALNRLMQKEYGGDHVHDAGRMMRLPGTYNFKDPANPRPSGVMSVPTSRYSVADVIAKLGEQGHANDLGVNQAAFLSSAAQIAVQHDPVLQQLPAETVSMMFEDRLVGTRSEHDQAVVNRLVEAGVDDSQIGALYARYPCGQKARENGFDKYLKRTIDKARNNGHLFLPRKKDIPENADELQRWIGEIRSAGKKAQSGQEAIAKIVVEYFDARATLFTDGRSKCFLTFDGKTVELSDNRQLRSFLQHEAGLSLENKDGKLTLDRLANHAIQHGQTATTRGLIYTDRRRHCIFIHHGQDDGRILRLSPGKIESVPNGANEDRVCLVPPDDFMGFKLDQDIDVAEALRLYEARLIDQMACDPIDRSFIRLWLPNVFLLDYSTVKILSKFSGPQGSGKSVATRLLGIVIAGRDILQARSTAPALWADAMPLKLLDNVENRNLRAAYEDFLIFAATGGVRPKMKYHSDGERICQHVNCLLVLNGIEALDKPEILSRLYEIEFRRQHQSSDFLETRILDELLESRSRILSGLLRMITDVVLPRIAAGGIEEWKRWLDSSYEAHPKARSFEFLARMGIIAEAMQRYHDPNQDVETVSNIARQQIDSILQRQAERAGEADVETNQLADLIQALVREKMNWDLQRGSFVSRYHVDIEIVGSKATLRATAGELLHAFSAFSKNLGVRRLDIRNSRSLSARLTSEQKILERCGIQVTRDGRRNNTNVYRFGIHS